MNICVISGDAIVLRVPVMAFFLKKFFEWVMSDIHQKKKKYRSMTRIHAQEGNLID
jgi:hypothetical protein